MSDYGRFRNALYHLRDCVDHLFDNDLLEEERDARQELIELCKEIVEEISEDVHDYN